MKIETSNVTSGMHVPREIGEVGIRSKKNAVSEVSESVMQLKNVALDEMKPTLKKPSSNVQPAAIQEQLSALTGESTSTIDH